MQTIPFPGNTPYPRSVSLWRPAGAPRALVLLSHGMAEHIARYDHVGAALAGRGYLVAGYNHLGHGAEAPRLGWFAGRDGWSRLVEDLKTVMDSLATPGLPRVLLGHSMGSFLAREYALRYPDGLDALVLSGTGWHPRLLCVAGLLPAKTLCFLGQGHKPSALLDRLAFSANNKPFASAGGTACDWLSRDARQVQAYLADPLCGFVFTASGFADLFVGLLDLSRTVRLKSLPPGLPVLLLSGSCDPVGGMGKGVHAVAGQYRDAGLGKVMTRLYEGARHEVFNETNRQEVLEDLAAWLNQLGFMKGEE
jgi:alpha-beta hydrolase superfamily lysophospholipase